MEVFDLDNQEMDLRRVELSEAFGGQILTDPPNQLPISDWLCRLTAHGIRLQTQPRPNTSPLFRVYDPRFPPLQDSPSPLHAPAWEILLQPCPGELSSLIKGMLTYGCLLGYEGPEQFHISRNLCTARFAPEIIQGKIQQDLHLRRVSPSSGRPPFMCSPLGLVLKHDGGWRRIHNLSHPRGTSINDHIPKEYGTLDYTNIYQIYNAVLAKA